MDVNIYTIIAAAIINLLLGYLWYSPLLFGRIWVKEHNLDSSFLRPSSLHYLGAIIVAIVTAWVFSILIHWFEITFILTGMQFGFLIWLGFVATAQFSGVIWAQKTIRAYLIDTGFQLVNLVIMGAILSIWF